MSIWRDWGRRPMASATKKIASRVEVSRCECLEAASTKKAQPAKYVLERARQAAEGHAHQYMP